MKHPQSLSPTKTHPSSPILDLSIKSLTPKGLHRKTPYQGQEQGKACIKLAVATAWSQPEQGPQGEQPDHTRLGWE